MKLIFRVLRFICVGNAILFSILYIGNGDFTQLKEINIAAFGYIIITTMCIQLSKLVKGGKK